MTTQNEISDPSNTPSAIDFGSTAASQTEVRQEVGNPPALDQPEGGPRISGGRISGGGGLAAEKRAENQAAPEIKPSAWESAMHGARVGKNLANIPIALLLARGFMDRAFESLAPIAGDGPMLWAATFAVVAAAFTRVLARNALKRAQFPIRFARLDAEDKARNQSMFRRWDAHRRTSWPAWIRVIDEWIENTGDNIQQRAKALFQR